MADYSRRKDRDFPAGGSSIEFIRVYLPDQSRERMLFPPAFSKQLKGNIPSKAIFEDLYGNQWDVDVDKTEDGVWFGNGWTQFAIDSHLKPGNFLVFQYDGISLFEVKIYRNDGCLELNVSGSGNKRINQETLVVDRFGVIKIKKEETICLEPTTTTSQLQMSDFDSMMPVKVEGTTSTVGKQRKSKSGVIVSPTSLYFTCVSRPLCLFVWLPRRIAKVIGPKLKPFMLFRDQFGQTSPVNTIGRFKGRLGFGKGWKEFCEKHPLGFNEEYLLEFSLSNNGRLRKVVDVRIQDRG